jgi:GR25 family glycosyltransferase involved in LPS biosynthesis
MLCNYINLKDAKARHLHFAENFMAFRSQHWELNRIEAVSANEVIDRPGSIRHVEKACFLSHKKANEIGSASNNAYMICEDDALFGPSSFKIIDRILSMRAPEIESFDIIFTDVGVPDISAMAALLKLKQQLAKTGSFELLDLKKIPFFGLVSYIVTKTGAKKIEHFLGSLNNLDSPVDIYLRSLIYKGAIRAGVIVPFATSASDDSEESQIQLSETERCDLVWSLFRKIFWVDGDYKKYAETFADIDRTNTPESKAYATILAAMANPEFVYK